MWVVHENFEDALFIRQDETLAYIKERRSVLAKENPQRRYVIRDHGSHYEVVEVTRGPVIIAHKHV